MKHGTLTIQFEHYWHCGSGQAGDGDVDAVPVVEECGLPFVPGRAIRGRLKWAAREAGWTAEMIKKVFGKPNAAGLDGIGIVKVPSAFMNGPFANAARAYFEKHRRPMPEVAALFEDIAATSRKDGVAEDRTLRRVRYSVPVPVITEIELEEIDDFSWKHLTQLAGKVRMFGKGKHDGYGWCATSLAEASETSPQTGKSGNSGDASVYELKMTLIDDIVLSASNATVGGHRTLDHVPGSALMGAFAGPFFKGLRAANHPDVESFGAGTLLSGAVSFGNGTPSAGGGGTVPVPFSWHHAKGTSAIEDDVVQSDRVANLACVDLSESALADAQPVQMRDGWIEPGTGRFLTIARNETLKTAINESLENYETAAEGQLYGYETIRRGSRFTARIEVPDARPDLCEAVRAAFDGTRIRLGRSKGTEFGRVQCGLKKVEENLVHETVTRGPIILFTESDLALLDEHGFPTHEPAPHHFGLGEGWQLCPARSYLRFRRYSLWNAKRGGPELERQVISKGSVIVFTHPSGESATATVKLRVGLGRAEGLGRVRVAEAWMNGPKPQFEGTVPAGAGRENAPSNETHVEDPFFKWIKARHREKRFHAEAETLGRIWRDDWSRPARKASLSPSQWGRLDQAARDLVDKKELLDLLGDPAKPNDKTLFGHGRKRKEWESGVGKAILKSLESQADGRLALAAFRIACHGMAARLRGKRD